MDTIFMNSKNLKTLKTHRGKTDNPSIRWYVKKIEKKIKFKIKRGFYLKHLTPETIKLIGSTEKRKIKIEVVKTFLI